MNCRLKSVAYLSLILLASSAPHARVASGQHPNPQTQKPRQDRDRDKERSANLRWAQRLLAETLLISEYRVVGNRKRQGTRAAPQREGARSAADQKRMAIGAELALRSARHWRPGQSLLSPEDAARILKAHPKQAKKSAQVARPTRLKDLTDRYLALLSSQKETASLTGIEPLLNAVYFSRVSEDSSPSTSSQTEALCSNRAQKRHESLPLRCSLEWDIRSGKMLQSRKRWIHDLREIVYWRHSAGAEPDETQSFGHTVLAAFYLEERNYPEALRGLSILQARFPEYRAAYDLAQRIYAAEQRGSGRVSIRGL